MTAIVAPPRPLVVLTGFAGYGALWGPYLASLPGIRAATGATTGQLGLALLVGAVAALPAMAWVGRLLDRHGRVVAVSVVISFAVAAVLPMWAGSVPGLVVAVALFGFGSGACNVVMVALASTAEAGTGVRVMNQAHALFSVGLLVCSLGTGALGAMGVPAGLLCTVPAACVVFWALKVRGQFPVRVRNRVRRRPVRPVALLCLLAGLAMLVESGVQQWSAVFLSDVVHAPLMWSSAAPGVFAGMMAAGRFGGHWLLPHTGERVLLVAAGVVSGCGVVLLATAGTPSTALVGTALVGLAISVATPTVYGLAGRAAPPGDSGAAIGATASWANLGLLLGPALLGQFADHTDLRTAVVVLLPACLAVCLLARTIPTNVRTR